MVFAGPAQEYLLLTELRPDNSHLLRETLKEGLTILWNTSPEARLLIDGVPVLLGAHQLLFLTEFHRLEVQSLQCMQLVRFNRPFYCIVDHDSEVGCKGILFFGAAEAPVVSIPDEELEKFQLLWRVFQIEMQSRDNLQFDMLQMMLKRLIILCTRLYKEQKQVIQLDHSSLDLIRDFNFLVERNYKTHRTVADYAAMLNRSPKTLSNLFTRHIGKTPLQVIQERIQLEARRLLRYSEQSIKEIAYETGFEDIQSFSRFFKKQEGISPSDFRKSEVGNRKGEMDTYIT